MIISRSPLRLTFGGGGTDLESYYSRFGGFFLSSAVDKYVYTSLSTPFTEGIFLKYSEYESVEAIGSIRHPILRSALTKHLSSLTALEVSSFADLPGGTGLGSSGAFAVATLRSIHRMKDETAPEPNHLAEEAHLLEAKGLGETAGKQDPYASALGGFRAFTVSVDGGVTSKLVDFPSGFKEHLNSSLHLYFTGLSRSSSEALKKQDSESRAGVSSMLSNLHQTKEIGYRSLAALENSDMESLSKLINAQWQQKFDRDSSAVSPHIQKMREIGLAAGASAGKLIGAGGGGFLLFLSEGKSDLDWQMKKEGFRKVPFNFVDDGVQDLV
jgi:D-glycero-alpha-D-manno-heptose-7-phosphate kinase